MGMDFLGKLAVIVAAIACGTVLAQPPQKPPPGFPDAPGKEILLAKCFQCHGPNMWTAQRQDRRAWESALYRMVGRGALWSEEEIKAMADYLGTVYGRPPK
jgi:mono/diheme cytochrome c family protein